MNRNFVNVHLTATSTNSNTNTTNTVDIKRNWWENISFRFCIKYEIYLTEVNLWFFRRCNQYFTFRLFLFVDPRNWKDFLFSFCLRIRVCDTKELLFHCNMFGYRAHEGIFKVFFFQLQFMTNGTSSKRKIQNITRKPGKCRVR